MRGPPDIWSTPRIFPHRLELPLDRVVVVERSEAELRAASFLDDRALGPAARPLSVAWAELGHHVPAAARRDLQYIFHIGHVGSTLIARLLGELPQVLALREPLILRGYADQLGREGDPDCFWAPEEIPARLDALTALLSRTFRPEQRALVKATSFVSDIAARLVPAGSNALLLWVPPEVYLASILAGDASRQEVQLLAAARVARLNRAGAAPPVRLWELSFGARAALGWAVEMIALRRAAAALGAARVLWVDFDTFLAAPAAGIARIAGHFGVPIDRAGAEALAGSEIMRRYSKAMEHGYSADLRRQVLAEARRTQAADLAAGLTWLEQVAAGDERLAECLRFAEGRS